MHPQVCRQVALVAGAVIAVLALVCHHPNGTIAQLVERESLSSTGLQALHQLHHLGRCRRVGRCVGWGGRNFVLAQSQAQVGESSDRDGLRERKRLSRVHQPACAAVPRPVVLLTRRKLVLAAPTQCPSQASNVPVPTCQGPSCVSCCANREEHVK